MSRSSGGKARGTGRTTLEQVAALAGVSIMTASRALSQPQLVSEATRAKVEQAVGELGYVPNRAARALASAQSHVIVVLVPSLSNAVFPAVLDGIHDAVGPSRYQLLIGNTHYSDAEEEKLLRVYLQSNPDGILLTSITHSPPVAQMLASSRVPVVSMMDLASSPDTLSVGFSQTRADGSAGTPAQAAAPSSTSVPCAAPTATARRCRRPGWPIRAWRSWCRRRPPSHWARN